VSLLYFFLLSCYCIVFALSAVNYAIVVYHIGFVIAFTIALTIALTVSWVGQQTRKTKPSNMYQFTWVCLVIFVVCQLLLFVVIRNSGPILCAP
jgi:hypothetical protein